MIAKIATEFCGKKENNLHFILYLFNKELNSQIPPESSFQSLTRRDLIVSTVHYSIFKCLNIYVYTVYVCVYIYK